MPRKATSRDVARLAGVSQTTVSYVMSGRRPVSAQTVSRVEQAMKELGYQPHSGARALRSQETHVIGLVVPYRHGADAASQHHFITTITSAVRRCGYDILLVTTDEGPSGVQRVINTALCDGLFIMEVLSNDPRAALIASADIPTVFLGVPDDGGHVVAVDGDYELAARQAVDRVVEAGYQRLVVVGAEHPSLSSLNFLDRFHHSIREYANERYLPLVSVASGSSLPAIVDTVRGLAQASHGTGLRGVGVIVGPIAPADSWCTALTHVGYTLGRDVGLVAASWDAEHARCLATPAHFDMRVDDLVSTAVDLMLAQLANLRSVPRETTLITPQFVPGDTL